MGGTTGRTGRRRRRPCRSTPPSRRRRPSTASARCSLITLPGAGEWQEEAALTVPRLPRANLAGIWGERPDGKLGCAIPTQAVPQKSARTTVAFVSPFQLAHLIFPPSLLNVFAAHLVIELRPRSRLGLSAV